MGDTEQPTSSADDSTDPFEWRRLDSEHSETSGDSSRRRRVRGIARPATGALVVAVLAMLLIGVVPQATMAHTTFTAGDVSLSTNSGQLTSLTVAPAGDVHYNGLETVPSSIDIAVSARLNSSQSWETVATQSVAGSGLEGSINYSIAEVDLLKQTSMSKNDFTAQDGSTETNDVDLRVQVTLVGAGPGGADVTASSTDTMTISITNEPAGAGVGGQANSNGSGA